MVQWWRQALWNWCIICRGAAYITDFISLDVPRPLHHRHSKCPFPTHAPDDRLCEHHEEAERDLRCETVQSEYVTVLP